MALSYVAYVIPGHLLLVQGPQGLNGESSQDPGP